MSFDVHVQSGVQLGSASPPSMSFSADQVAPGSTATEETYSMRPPSAEPAMFSQRTGARAPVVAAAGPAAGDPAEVVEGSLSGCAAAEACGAGAVEAAP